MSEWRRLVSRIGKGKVLHALKDVTGPISFAACGTAPYWGDRTSRWEAAEGLPHCRRCEESLKKRARELTAVLARIDAANRESVPSLTFRLPAHQPGQGTPTDGSGF